MIGAERVLEPRVCGAGVDEEREPELANVSEPLKGRCVDQLEAERIEPDVVPEWVADDLDGHDRETRRRDLDVALAAGVREYDTAPRLETP